MAYSRAVVLAIFALDIIAFGLAIGAESRRSHASVTTTKSSTDATLTYCKYSRDVSTGLGIAAFVFLFFGQMLVTGITRCLCCSTPLTPGGSRGFAILFFVLSWFSFVIAEICLIAGATKAAYRTRFNTNNTQIYDCESLRRGIFSSAAAFAFFTLFLTEAYYWFYCKARDKSWQTFYGNPPYGGGAAGPGANPYNPYNSNPFTTATPPPAYGVPYTAPPPPPGQSIGMAAYPPRAS